MGWQRRGTFAGHKAREAGRPWPVVVSSMWVMGYGVGHVWAPGFMGLPIVVVGVVLITEAIETAELVVGVAILSGCRCGTADCINLATDIQNSKTTLHSSLLRLPQSFVFKSTVVLEIRLHCCKISAICCRVDNTRASLRSCMRCSCTGRLPTTHAPTLL